MEPIESHDIFSHSQITHRSVSLSDLANLMGSYPYTATAYIDHDGADDRPQVGYWVFCPAQ